MCPLAPYHAISQQPRPCPLVSPETHQSTTHRLLCFALSIVFHPALRPPARRLASVPVSPLPTSKSYGVNPTFNFLLTLIFTLAECSPTTQLPRAASDDCNPGNDDRRGGGVGGGVGGGDGRSADSSGGGSGLSAGTDALRLACLECLEVRCSKTGSWAVGVVTVINLMCQFV